MTVEKKKITIIATKKPNNENVNDSLRWLGLSLGLFTLRDKEQSCFRLFIELIKNSKTEGISSDEIAYKLNLSRGTVIHHINRLKDSGIVVDAKHGYMLRTKNLHELVDIIEKDIHEAVSDLRDVAENIDKILGL